MNKAELNYWIDVSIGVTCVLSVFTGLVLLLPVSFDSGLSARVLGVSYQIWSDVHTWSSLAMVVGVVAHLTLHWGWMVSMGKRILRITRRQEVTATRELGVANKASIAFCLDAVMGAAFLLCAMSGLVLLLPANLASGSGLGILSIHYRLWSDVHTWSGLVMGAAVAAHLVLHWKWVFMMTKKTLLPEENQPEAVDLAPGVKVNRRQFLYLGLNTVIAGAVVMCFKAIGGTPTIEAGQGSAGDGLQPDEWTQSWQEEGGVACPRGLVNDPYPGHCRLYTDENGDSICDHSVPGSGYNRVRN